ncbi:Platelet glycoprotein IX [Oryzias melastigma]|uniref:Platelet glycoprotein IX n=1 Tax=Oryzias melastigma TaxID=30732 RepID=A0A834F250_ORYME|nr:Platelet glycoprotein IX [Oryzias melastigma]
MLFLSLSLAVYLLLASSNAQISGRPCICSAPVPAGLSVNCSSLNLTFVPHLPSNTTELHMQDNQLTSVDPGLFDPLVSLRQLSLSGNPFHCDCRIQYLRNWLLKNRHVISEVPTCSTPSSVAHKAITELTDQYFSSCATPSCAYATDALMVGMLLCLLLLFLWSLTLARRSTFTLSIDERHSGFQSDSLRSLRPKHRRRLHTGDGGDSEFFSCSEDLERPLLNMELLPQVLDALQTKHNIKIKAT